jgi:hypothetical protein
MLATGPAMAPLSVSMMPVGSVWRFAMDRSASGAGVGNEMTLVKTLARARIRVNFMLTVSLGELSCREILSDRKEKEKREVIESLVAGSNSNELLRWNLKTVQFAADTEVILIPTCSVGRWIDRHHLRNKQPSQRQDLENLPNSSDDQIAINLSSAISFQVW